MREKIFKLFILILLAVFILPVGAKAEYTPSLSLSSYLTLSQNKSISNYDLPLRTSGNFELSIVPLSFRFDSKFIFDIALSFYSNTNSIAWNNTQLLGFYGVEPALLLGGNINRYQIKAGIGFSYNKYYNEDFYFFALTGILNQSIILNEYFSFTIPFKFSYRQELLDYRIGFALSYYPKGGAI